MRDINSERTAIHEAGHATVAILKHVLVTGLRIFDTSEEIDGKMIAGLCTRVAAPDWHTEISILVAGAAAEAAYFKDPFPRFYDGGWSDFGEAFNHALELVRPKAPEEFSHYLENDADDFLCAVRDGWYPPGLHGQAKRRLTLYAKRYGEASDFACDLVHQEAKRVTRLFQTDSAHKKLCGELASSLQRTGALTTHDILECLEGLSHRCGEHD